MLPSMSSRYNRRSKPTDALYLATSGSVSPVNRPPHSCAPAPPPAASAAQEPIGAAQELTRPATRAAECARRSHSCALALPLTAAG